MATGNSDTMATDKADEIEDFSKPITFVPGPKTGVFWDVEDSPFPDELDNDTIYRDIESALITMDFNCGHMSIWAYVDENKNSKWFDFLSEKKWKTRIYFLPGGVDKQARVNRMLHDFILWTIDSPVNNIDPVNVIVIANQVRDDPEFYSSLKTLYNRDYNVFLAHGVAPVRSENSDWALNILNQGEPIIIESTTKNKKWKPKNRQNKKHPKFNTDNSDSMATDKPNTMATGNSDTMATDNSDTMATDKPDTMATDKPDTMATDKPDTMATDKPDTMATDKPDTMTTDNADVIEDFSKRITVVPGPKTGVFWDVEDFPFPDELENDTIYRDIESAFAGTGCNCGHMSIWAYVGEVQTSKWRDFLSEKNWKTRIYFLPGGDAKLARRDRMLHDIILWIIDVNPLYSRNLMVISNQVRKDVEFVDFLRKTASRGYNVFLADGVAPERSENTNWAVNILNEGGLI